MEKLIIFSLCTAGISWIICNSKLLQPFREGISELHIKHKDVSVFGKLLWFIESVTNCVGCCGVYAGALSYLLIYDYSLFPLIAYSLSGSILSMKIIAFNTSSKS